MKIVVLDGYTENPGDLSWAGLEALGEVSMTARLIRSLPSLPSASETPRSWS